MASRPLECIVKAKTVAEMSTLLAFYFALNIIEVTQLETFWQPNPILRNIAFKVICAFELNWNLVYASNARRSLLKRTIRNRLISRSFYLIPEGISDEYMNFELPLLLR